MMTIPQQQRQDAFLAALMTGLTIEKAAVKAKISEKTAYTYLNDDKFQNEYQKRRDEALTAVSNTLRNTMSEAVCVVQSIMRDTSANQYHRLSAARLILEQAARTIEVTEIVQRLARVEKKLLEGNIQKVAE